MSRRRRSCGRGVIDVIDGPGVQHDVPSLESFIGERVGGHVEEQSFFGNFVDEHGANIDVDLEDALQSCDHFQQLRQLHWQISSA